MAGGGATAITRITRGAAGAAGGVSSSAADKERPRGVLVKASGILKLLQCFERVAPVAAVGVGGKGGPGVPGGAAARLAAAAAGASLHAAAAPAPAAAAPEEAAVVELPELFPPRTLAERVSAAMREQRMSSKELHKRVGKQLYREASREVGGVSDAWLALRRERLAVELEEGGEGGGGAPVRD